MLPQWLSLPASRRRMLSHQRGESALDVRTTEQGDIHESDSNAASEYLQKPGSLAQNYRIRAGVSGDGEVSALLAPEIF